MNLCHNTHFPYSCDDDYLHQVHHHHHHNHHSWCNSYFHSSCLTGQVSITKEDGFQLQIDVHHFKYDELNVKTLGDWIIVEGKQTNDNDEPVCITKQFSRKYKLPRHYNSNLIQTTLSSKGILLVKVPSPPEIESENEEKIIEIKKSDSFASSDNKKNMNTDKNNKKDDNNSKSDIKKDKNDNKNLNKQPIPDTSKIDITAKVDVTVGGTTASATATNSIPAPSGNTTTGVEDNDDKTPEQVNDNNISTQNDDKMNNDNENI